MKLLAALALLVAAMPVTLPAQPSDFLRCADGSFLDDVERGGAFAHTAPLVHLRDAGINSVRLRLFHSPTVLSDSLPAVLALARRTDALGLSLVLDLRYSDTWANPSAQTTPAAWHSLDYAALRDSVGQYSRRVVQAFVDQGTTPVLVQVGNETTGGMLWPTGCVGGTFDTPTQWHRLAGLLTSGIRSAAPNADLVLHLHDGGSLLPATSALGRTRATESTRPTTPSARLTIHPNPASGLVRIRLPDAQGCSRVVFADVLGRERIAADVCGSEAQLDVRALAAGLYLIDLRHERGYAAGTRLIARAR